MVAVKDSTGAVQYLLTDHLGSTVATVNASGTLTSQQRYLPFGAERNVSNSPILGTDFGYRDSIPLGTPVKENWILAWAESWTIRHVFIRLILTASCNRTA